MLEHFAGTHRKSGRRREWRRSKRSANRSANQSRNDPQNNQWMIQKRMTLTAPRRVLSIDVLRGITIAFMILVNDPGDWGHVYGQLDHCPWNGLTLTDLVFPTFLFLMGASLIYSIEARRARGNCRLTLTGHIVRRAAI